MIPFNEEKYWNLPQTYEIKSGDYYIELLAKNAKKPVDSNVLRLMHNTLAVEKIRRQKYGN